MSKVNLRSCDHNVTSRLICTSISFDASWGAQHNETMHGAVALICEPTGKKHFGDLWWRHTSSKVCYYWREHMSIIKNLKYTSCRVLWAYKILQLSKRSVIYPGSDAVLKLQKGDVRSGHWNWPAVTWPSEIESQNLHIMCKNYADIVMTWFVSQSTKKNSQGGGGYPLL